MMTILKKVFGFYSAGFRNMVVGKTLWAIILIKLFILFVLFRLFLFHDYLGSKFSSEQDKSNYVIEQLTK